MRGRLAITLVLLLLVATAAAAQFRPGGRGFGGQVRYAAPEDFDGGFQFCRVVFNMAPNGDGGNWSVDWPRADENLSVRLAGVTETPGTFGEGHPPDTPR